MATPFKREVFLSTEWLLAHRAFNCDPSWPEYRTLRTAYSSPSRYYHTWQHIYNTCLFVRQNYCSQPIAILALFYHDVIYDVSRKDNERASAEQWMSYATKRGLEYADALLVYDLIIMTEKHRVKDQQPHVFRMVSDADMSVFLCEDDDEYAEYARNIWREYSSVGHKAYLSGRLQFLETVVPEHVFLTAEAKAKVKMAKRHLGWERNVLASEPEKIMVAIPDNEPQCKLPVIE